MAAERDEVVMNSGDEPKCLDNPWQWDDINGWKSLTAQVPGQPIAVDSGEIEQRVGS